MAISSVSGCAGLYRQRPLYGVITGPSAPADLELIEQLKGRLQYAELKIRVLEERLRLVRIAKYGPGSEKLLIPPDIAQQVSLDLLGLITGLPAETAQIPWDAPQVRIIEHQAHAPGHAALLIEERGVLVAGDMLSDVLIPLLDFNDTADPIEDYLAALRLLEGVTGDIDVFVPGHGSIGGADQVHARIDQDRAYVHALRDPDGLSDPRVGSSATYGKDWLPGVHARQLQRLAQRRERDGTPG